MQRNNPVREACCGQRQEGPRDLSKDLGIAKRLDFCPLDRVELEGSITSHLGPLEEARFADMPRDSLFLSDP